MRYHVSMIQNLFPLFATLLLAAPGRAAVVAPMGAGGRAWVSPVAGVFASVGSERIATMGSPALTALSTLDSSARYPFASAPQSLDLLAKNLQYYAAPAAFAAMPAEDKLIALRAAAKGAEIEAAAVADKALAAAGARPFHPSSVDQTSEQIAQAEAVALYLDAPRREAAARMRSRLASFQSRWRRHVKAFEEDLPGKIASGAFDASNVLVKTPHGWVAADESPYPIGTDLAKFYERRTAALSKAPKGPWSIQEASLLIQALARPDVGAGKSWASPARQNLQNIIYSAQVGDGADLPLQNALEAFGKQLRYGRLLPARQVLFVETRYADLGNSAAAQPTPIRLRILASMLNGAGGFPSWERFRDMQRNTLSWTRRNAMVAAGFVIAGMIAMALLSTAMAAWPLAAKLAVFALGWLAPGISYTRNLMLAAQLESDTNRSRVWETIRRAFPND